MASYVQYSDFKQNPFCNNRQTYSDWQTHFNVAWPFAVHTCFVPSVLSHKKRWSKGLSDDRSQSLPSYLPYPSPQSPPNGLRTSPHQVGGPKTATALPLYKKPSVSNFCSLLIVLKCTAFFITHSWYLCPSLWEGEQQFLCFQVTKTFLRGKKKIGIIFPKLNKGGANTSSNCGCFSFTYLPSQENNLSST